MAEETKDDVMLTTTDNPYNPFTHFDEWYVFDEDHGYHTCSLLARTAKTSSILPDILNEMLIEDAIDEICEMNVSGMHTKVYRNAS